MSTFQAFLAGEQMRQHQSDLATQLAEAAKDRAMRQSQFDASMLMDRERIDLMRKEEQRRAQEAERAHALATAQLFGSDILRKPGTITLNPIPASAPENGTGVRQLPSVMFQTATQIPETGDPNLGGGILTTPEERNARAVQQQLKLNEAISAQHERLLTSRARSFFPNDIPAQNVFRMYGGDLSKLDDNNMQAASILAKLPSDQWIPTITRWQQLRYNNPYLAMQRSLGVQEDQAQAAARSAIGEAIAAASNLPAEAQEASVRSYLQARIKDPAVLSTAFMMVDNAFRANRANTLSPKDQALAPVWDEVGKALRNRNKTPVQTSTPPQVQPGQTPPHPAGGTPSVNPQKREAVVPRSQSTSPFSIVPMIESFNTSKRLAGQGLDMLRQPLNAVGRFFDTRRY